MKDVFKEFKLSSWAINNRITIYVLTVVITFAGLKAYESLPKESFPEIVIPKIFVSTVYPGTSPANMENLVTKHLEKQVKSIAGVKKITSNSYQDYSNVIIEFNTDVDIPVAKQKVKDAVDKAKPDLPNDLPAEPSVIDINLRLASMATQLELIIWILKVGGGAIILALIAAVLKVVLIK